MTINRQIRELREGTLHRMSRVSQQMMGEDHARAGGSAMRAYADGTEDYKRGFAEQAYAQMQTSRLWTDPQKQGVRDLLEMGHYGSALIRISSLNNEPY